MSDREALLKVANELQWAKEHLSAAYCLSLDLLPGTQEAACDVLRMCLKDHVSTLIHSAEEAADGKDTGPFAAARKPLRTA